METWIGAGVAVRVGVSEGVEVGVAVAVGLGGGRVGGVVGEASGGGVAAAAVGHVEIGVALLGAGAQATSRTSMNSSQADFPMRVGG
jgi:hypothetical protein